MSAEVKAAKQQCLLLRERLEYWQRAGALVPFSTCELAAGIGASGEIGLLAKGLLGSLWKCWYPPEVDPDRVWPRQAAHYLYEALKKVTDNGEGETPRTRAAEAPEEFVEKLAKCRRIQ